MLLSSTERVALACCSSRVYYFWLCVTVEHSDTRRQTLIE